MVPSAKLTWSKPYAWASWPGANVAGTSRISSGSTVKQVRGRRRVVGARRERAGRAGSGDMTGSRSVRPRLRGETEVQDSLIAGTGPRQTDSARTRDSLEKPLVPHPRGARVHPGGTWPVGPADAEVVGGVRVDVQLRGHAGALQRPVHYDAVLRFADNVRPAMHKEHGRRALWYAQAGGELVLVLGLQVARVDRNGEVRAATDLVDLVGRLVGPLLEPGRGRDCEVAAGRESDDADAIGCDAPLLRLAADEADGALGVLEGP